VSTQRIELLSPRLMSQLERLELVSRKMLRGRVPGERRGVRKGPGVELADFRNYVAGDDLRFVDWNIYARLDRLFLRLFFEDEDLHFYALIDNSPSMDFGSPTKLDYARQLAAALGFVALVRGDRVRIETLARSSQQSAPALRGRQSVERMLDGLEAIEPGPPRPLEQSIRNFCLRNPPKGIVVVISDLLDKQGHADALRHLVARGMDVLVAHVLSPEELEPELVGDLELVDSEDGDVAEVSAGRETFARYRRTLTAFLASARDACARRGINYLLADTRVSVERLVSGYLRKRGLVR
jgi:uncharacterized protein (DUF58 family)